MVSLIGDGAPRLLRRMRRERVLGAAAGELGRQIAAGTLDAPTGLTTTTQIFVAHAGDYYTIDPAIPQRAD